MEILHQVGHNYKWNIDSFSEDDAGDGLIFSPVNMPSDKTSNLPLSLREVSLFDPQIFFPDDPKGKLETYEYFPANIVDDFASSDFANLGPYIAERCVEFQEEMDFREIIIPTRYFTDEPSDLRTKLQSQYIDPFLHALEGSTGRNILLTSIIKEGTLVDNNKRNSMLDWLTGIPDIDGYYLIFDIKNTSKQIKDPDVLAEAMYFIHALKENGQIVRVGYTNTEAYIYSLAFPDSVTMGSYENVRSFSNYRFVTCENRKQHGPNPRLYSAELLQWVEYTYIKAIISLVDDGVSYFNTTYYAPIMFEPSYKWWFSKPELYKHFFINFSRQIQALPDDYDVRKHQILNTISEARENFREITERVDLDSDSDGSHLPNWRNAISIFERKVNDR